MTQTPSKFNGLGPHFFLVFIFLMMDAHFKDIAFSTDEGDCFFLPDGLLDGFVELDDADNSDQFPGPVNPVSAPPEIIHEESSLLIGGDLLLRCDSSDTSRHGNIENSKKVYFPHTKSHPPSLEASPFPRGSLSKDLPPPSGSPLKFSFSLLDGKLIEPVGFPDEASSYNRVIGPKKHTVQEITPLGFSSPLPQNGNISEIRESEDWPLINLTSTENLSNVIIGSVSTSYNDSKETKLVIPPLRSTGYKCSLSSETSSTTSSSESAYSIDCAGNIEHAHRKIPFTRSVATPTSVVTPTSKNINDSFKNHIDEEKADIRHKNSRGSVSRTDISSKSKKVKVFQNICSTGDSNSTIVSSTRKHVIDVPQKNYGSKMKGHSLSSLDHEDNLVRGSKNYLKTIKHQSLEKIKIVSDKGINEEERNKTRINKHYHLPKENLDELSKQENTKKGVAKNPKKNVSSVKAPEVEQDSSLNFRSGETLKPKNDSINIKFEKRLETQPKSTTKDRCIHKMRNDTSPHHFVSSQLPLDNKGRTSLIYSSERRSNREHRRVPSDKKGEKASNQRTNSKKKNLQNKKNENSASTISPITGAVFLKNMCSDALEHLLYILQSLLVLTGARTLLPCSIRHIYSYLDPCLVEFFLKSLRAYSSSFFFWALSLTCRMYKISYGIMWEHENVRMCFFVPYFFPSLVNSLYQWFGYCYWLPICLWYTFLFELFSPGENDKATMIVLTPASRVPEPALKSAASRTLATPQDPSLWQKVRSTMPVVAIFVMFVAEGIWSTCIVLDLNGSELVLIGYFLAAIQQSCVFSPVFMGSWAVGAMLSSYFFSLERSGFTVYFVEHLQLLFSLCCLSLINHVKIMK